VDNHLSGALQPEIVEEEQPEVVAKTQQRASTCPLTGIPTPKFDQANYLKK